MFSLSSLTARKEQRICKGTLIVIFLALTAVSSALAAHPKLSTDLQEASGAAPLDVIVQFASPVQQHHLDKVAAHGGTYKATLTGIRGGAFSLNGDAVKELAEDPEVAFTKLRHIRPPKCPPR